MNVGAHVRGGGQLIPSLEAGVEIGATSIQVFVQSPRMWKPTQYAPSVLAAYREAQAAHPSVTSTFSHATYLINLASPDPELYQRSVDCLVNNVSVSRGMGASGVVLHVGSHMGAGFDTALPQIAEGLQRALDQAEPAPAGVDCPILIENAAGTGGTVGRDFDEIEAIIAACGGDERLGLCVDTQHLWASGEDYSTVDGAAAVLAKISRQVGLDRLRCLHLNDSKIELGANRDRHANIGEGTIGEAGLAPLVGHFRIRDLPLLLEVPGDGDGPRAEDVIAAQRTVVRGAALYGVTLEMPPPPPKRKATSTKKAKKATKKAATKVTKKVAKKATKKVAKKVAKKAAKKVAKGPTKKATKKTTAKPVKKVAKKGARPASATRARGGRSTKKR
ncbi:MAG TPA: deoxyribonuclease IV [Acidimicrobiales bacterium]|nr:deoxyribonuclease IV [Acidimicrobiales bacterium]